MSSRFIPLEAAQLSWRDGFPYSANFNDIYFSETGLEEAQHVFIEGNKLLARWQALPRQRGKFIIAETGFGTGLNFLLSWFLWVKFSPPSARLHFISCEKHPLPREDFAACLKLWPSLEEQARLLLKNYPILTPGFHQLSFDNDRITLTLMLGDAAECYDQLLICGDDTLEAQLRTSHVDAWFLDGFAPAKNPQMWSPDLFRAIGLLSKSGTTAATFSVADGVKTNLQAAGFNVSKVAGFGRKREMLVANYQHPPSLASLKKRTTPWHVGQAEKAKSNTAIVIGAGLAGCYLAHSLAKRGWQVKLIDETQTLGEGASANQQAVLYPLLSVYRSPLTVFTLTAFLHAIRVYSNLLEKQALGELKGLLQFACSDREKKVHLQLREWLKTYPELGRLLDAKEASQIAGMQIEDSALFIPRSGWLDMPAICKLLATTPGVEWIPDTSVREFSFENNQWQVGVHSAYALIVANGYRASQFEQTLYLPLKPIRGQITMIPENADSVKLQVPLCGIGHILPPRSRMHTIGSTYQLDSVNKNLCSRDNISNLSKLTKLPISANWTEVSLGGWAGVRATTPDYLPVVGPVSIAEDFRSRFATLATNAKRWIPLPGNNYPRLFVCAGFGSRGLTSIPLCAEWLSSQINNEFSFIPRSMAQSVSPARFLRKELIKSI